MIREVPVTRRKRLDLSLAVVIAASLVAGIGVGALGSVARMKAAGEPIVHRDVKPDNVIPKASGVTLQDSAITDDGTTVTVRRNLLGARNLDVIDHDGQRYSWTQPAGGSQFTFANVTAGSGLSSFGSSLSNASTVFTPAIGAMPRELWRTASADEFVYPERP